MASRANPDPRWGGAISAAQAALPKPLAGWQASAAGNGASIKLTLLPPSGAPDPGTIRFFPFAADKIDPSGPQPVTREGNAYVIALPVAHTLAGPLDRLAGVLTAATGFGQARAATIDVAVAGTVAAGAKPVAAATPALNLAPVRSAGDGAVTIAVAIVSALAAPDARLVSIALGFGLALLIGLYAFGEVSGGHFNPVVSLAMFLDRRLPMEDMIGYWISQAVGAILASIVVLIAYDDNVVAGTTTQATDTWAAIVVEIVMTALFVAVILQVTRSDKYGRSALVAIPLALVAIHVATIPISGASVNPARSLGPALVGTEFTDFWIYLIAPPIGAVLGWMAHRVVVMGDTNFRDDIDAMRRRPGDDAPASTPHVMCRSPHLRPELPSIPSAMEQAGFAWANVRLIGFIECT